MMFYLAPNSPYQPALKHFTFRALAYGYYSKEWGVRNLMSYQKKMEENKAKTLHFHQLKSLFFYFVSGLGLSVLLFVAEIVWFRYSKKDVVLEYK